MIGYHEGSGGIVTPFVGGYRRPVGTVGTVSGVLPLAIPPASAHPTKPRTFAWCRYTSAALFLRAHCLALVGLSDLQSVPSLLRRGASPTACFERTGCALLAVLPCVSAVRRQQKMPPTECSR